IGQAQVSALRQAGLEAPLDATGLDRAEGLLKEVAVAARAALAEQGAEAGAVRQTLRLRYDGADAELPVPLADLAIAKAQFEDAHQRLFGFIEPDRTILIAAVEAEASSAPSPLAGEGGGRRPTDEGSPSALGATPH